MSITPTMQTLDFFWLLCLLCGLLSVIGGLLLNNFGKQKLLPGKCLIFGLAGVGAILLIIGSSLIATPQAEQNADWSQKVYWTLGIGYAFSLPTMVYLLITRENSVPPSPRTQLLNAVQDEVKERLEYSLHNEKLIPLSKQPQADRTTLLKRLEYNVKKLLHNSEVDADTPIVDIFKQPKVKEQLLILGAPGAGKTTTLVELARELIVLAMNNENERIPILLDISTWSQKQPIDEWIVTEINNKYNIYPKVGKYLLDGHRLLPLLDGLDRLKETQRNNFIQEINKVLEIDRRLQPLVVCSRSKTYNKCSVKLNLKELYLLPLSEQQVKNHLKDTNRLNLWQNIKSDLILKKLATSPFLLTIMVVTSDENIIPPANHITSILRREFYLECLFDNYLQYNLKDNDSNLHYSPRETKRCLNFLAEQMEIENKTEFVIEKMQPTWLTKTSQKNQYRLYVGFLTTLTSWLISYSCILIGGQKSDLSGELLTGILIGGWGYLRYEITPIENLGFFWKKFYTSFKDVLTSGLNFFTFISWATALITILYLFVTKQLTIDSALVIFAISGWVLCLVVFSILLLALIYSLGICLQGNEIPESKRKSPNKGIINSLLNAAIFAIIVGLVSTLFLILFYWIFYWFNLRFYRFILPHNPTILESVSTGILFGMHIGLLYPGLAVIQHLVLRGILWRSGSIPWNYAHFLKYAADSRFIQPVGGRYRFIHDLLQEHFAKLKV